MKKSMKRIGIGGLLTALGLGNATLKIDNNMHYFANGILAGIGISMLAREMTKKCKCKMND